jgi:hypothetical protein
MVFNRVCVMAHYEEIKRIDCQSSDGRRLTIIEQRKWAVSRSRENSPSPVYDYMTEDGEIASKLDDENFLLLMTAEVFHKA